MNFLEKFLLLFADYRDMREENIRQGDEILQLRAQIEDERKRFDEMTSRYISREELLNDRFLEAKFTQRLPEPRPVTDKPEDLSQDHWKKKSASDLITRMRERQQRIPDGPGQDSTRTN